MLGAGSGADSSVTTSAESCAGDWATSGDGPGVRGMYRLFVVGSNGLMIILLMGTYGGVPAWAK